MKTLNDLIEELEHAIKRAGYGEETWICLYKKNDDEAKLLLANLKKDQATLRAKRNG